MPNGMSGLHSAEGNPKSPTRNECKIAPRPQPFPTVILNEAEAQ